jgi:membrane-associated phospholipid phosphatase
MAILELQDVQGSMAADRHGRRLVAYAVLALLGVWAIAAAVPGIDRTIITTLNRAAGNPLDPALVLIGTAPSFHMAVLIACLWYCWFATERIEARAAILTGTVAALAAGVVSRGLQVVLTTHQRPIHDPSLAFNRPVGAETALNTWNSFPSDHATVLAGLLVTLWMARFRYRWILVPVVVVAGLARVYIGAHYPTDMIGGYCLAVAVVGASRAARVQQVGLWIASAEAKSRPAFYMAAFYFSDQLSALFIDWRALGTAFLHFLKHIR